MTDDRQIDQFHWLAARHVFIGVGAMVMPSHTQSAIHMRLHKARHGEKLVTFLGLAQPRIHHINRLFVPMTLADNMEAFARQFLAYA